jgi:hypothetical protein
MRLKQAQMTSLSAPKDVYALRLVPPAAPGRAVALLVLVLLLLLLAAPGTLAAAAA